MNSVNSSITKISKSDGSKVHFTLSGMLEDAVSILLDVILTRLHNITHRTAQQTMIKAIKLFLML